MFDIGENISIFLNELQLSLISGLCNLLEAIETFIYQLITFDFLNEAYFEILQEYEVYSAALIAVVTVCVTTYSILLKPTNIPNVMKNFIFSLLGISLFTNLFSFAVIDLGGGIINDLNSSTNSISISSSVRDYSVMDYSTSAEDNGYYYDFTSSSFNDIKIDEILKEDVIDSSGKVVAQKGDLRYPVNIFSGLIYGLLLTIGLLLICLKTAVAVIEVFVSGIIGLFALAFNVANDSKFFRNFITSLLLMLGKMYANLLMLSLFTLIISNISNSISNANNYNSLQSFLLIFILNLGLIWVIINGSEIFKKTFGIDLGLSDVGASMVQNQMLQKIATSPKQMAKASIAAGTNAKGLANAAKQNSFVSSNITTTPDSKSAFNANNNNSNNSNASNPSSTNNSGNLDNASKTNLESDNNTSNTSNNSNLDNASKNNPESNNNTNNTSNNSNLDNASKSNRDSINNTKNTSNNSNLDNTSKNNPLEVGNKSRFSTNDTSILNSAKKMKGAKK